MRLAMSVAIFVAVFFPVCVGGAVALFLSMMAASPEAERNQRRARARDLARYRHHPDANLLSLND
jgi:hypothetical protein